MSEPNYGMIAENDAYVIIWDIGPWDKHKTITNGAESVVADLTRMLNGRKLYYIDSDDNCDQLLHDGNGKFLGFKAGGPI